MRCRLPARAALLMLAGSMLPATSLAFAPLRHAPCALLPRRQASTCVALRSGRARPRMAAEIPGRNVVRVEGLLPWRSHAHRDTAICLRMPCAPAHTALRGLS